LDPIELNSSLPPLLSLCSQDGESRQGIEDNSIGMSYELRVPCGVTQDQAIQRFRQLRKEQDSGLWRSPAARLQATMPFQKIRLLQEVQESSDEVIKNVLGILSLGLLGNFGCNPTRFPEPGHVYSKGNLKLRLDLDGDPEVGEIMFIRQSHLPDPDLSTESITESKLMDIGLYQAEIFYLLEDLQPKHLFLEGLPVDFPPSMHNQLILEVQKGYKDFRGMFVEGESPEERKRKSLILLSMLGAGLTYALNHADVFLHKTHTEEENLWLENQRQKHLEKYRGDSNTQLQDTSFWEIILNKRETWVTRELTHFLRDHPGEKAVLIYGALHNFCDDFIREGLKPYILSVWWELTDSHRPLPIPSACP
jgi:hypothetical protein